MTIVKWSPQRSVFNNIDSWFDMVDPNFKNVTNDNWKPSFDISESNTVYKITVDLPGLDKNDISVDVSDNSLVISGERGKKEPNKIDYNYNEIRYGKFERSFSLSDGCIQDKISANMKNGVLEVSIPKTKELVKTSKKIKIK